MSRRVAPEPFFAHSMPSIGIIRVNTQNTPTYLFGASNLVFMRSVEHSLEQFHCPLISPRLVQ